MMSQKSLKNNVNLNDFKRSLLGSILFPAIALIVFFIGMTMPVISYVTSDEFLSTPVHNEVSVFLADNSMFSYSFSLLPVGMVLCGMMTAIKSFYFMLRKNQVNVFFSIGVSRRTMYINRILSGVITLFVAVLVPMSIIYIINIASFGVSSYLTTVFLYAVALFFTCGLAGFGIGSAAMMISGNIFEAVLTCVTPTIIPLLIANLADGFCNNFLKGYVNIIKDTSWLNVLSPWGIATNLGADYPTVNYSDVYYSKVGSDKILGLMTRNTTPDKFVVPESYRVDLDLTLPIIIWLAVSVALVVLGAFLFKARKAEHANSFGHFAISRAINSTFVFVVAAYIFLMALDYMVSPLVYFLITLIAGALAYFLVQLIMTRKMKTTLKSMAWYGVLAGVLAVALVVVGTGFFGTYNKTPDKAEIKSVSAELTLLEVYPHYIYTYDNTEDFVESETDESKEAILKAFELVKNEKVKYGENSIENVTFVFRDKNNELMYREFAIYSAETYYDYLKTLYGSDYFDAILEEYLLNDPPEHDSPYVSYEYDQNGNIIDVMEYYSGNDSAGYLKNMLWCYSSNNMLLGVEYLPSGEYEQEMVPTAEFVENSEELCKALYKDLTKMTFEQFFHNTSKPVGILTTDGGHVCFDKDEFVYPLDDYGVIMDDTTDEDLPSVIQAGVHTIPVYPEMTETVKYLESNGYEINKVDLTVKEVLYTDSPLTDNEVTHIYADKNSQKYKGYGNYNHYFVNRPDDITMFYNTDFGYGAFELVGYFIDEKLNNLDMLKSLYKDAGHPLKSVTDTAKAEEIIGKSVSQYLVYGDNGRYVYVVYEEGPVVCYYLPEANVSALK